MKTLLAMLIALICIGTAISVSASDVEMKENPYFIPNRCVAELAADVERDPTAPEELKKILKMELLGQTSIIEAMLLVVGIMESRDCDFPNFSGL
ncbi:MAG: hypothetical protein HYT27_00640 [Parcubacteria group bacterium]|nr:hypothetical protein [Parcubacteria group bacterium]